ncbi:uncharacterized protein [Bemisia tabaci]|uniref:uncharacterized protein n=1 Tax=Bemisia tabaci TaxID=7038 RepID=UPI003B281B8A
MTHYHGPANMKIDNVNDYELAGQLIAMSLLQEGPGPNFFSSDLYNGVISGDIENVLPESIRNPMASKDLATLMSASTIEELREAVLLETAIQAGVTSYPTGLPQKEAIVQRWTLSLRLGRGTSSTQPSSGPPAPFAGQAITSKLASGSEALAQQIGFPSLSAMGGV